MHLKHIERLKGKLKEYNLDMFGKDPAIHMSSGQEIDMSKLQGLMKALG